MDTNICLFTFIGLCAITLQIKIILIILTMLTMLCKTLVTDNDINIMETDINNTLICMDCMDIENKVK